MKLATLAKKAAALPAEISFSFAGPEQWHNDVFTREVKTLEDAIQYVNALRGRMAEYAMALQDLADAYKQMRDLMLEAEVGDN
jgi:hypothetical protein